MLQQMKSEAARRAPKLAAAADWLRPQHHMSWGGPMNGQRGRRAITIELLRLLRPTLVLETGTHRGTTAAFLADVSGATVHTVDLSPRYLQFARWRNARRPDVVIYLDDSRAFLRHMAERRPGETTFVYLDAHWEDDLPLVEEIEVATSAWPRSAIMIDDFRVPDDSGYYFYEPAHGVDLREESLPTALLQGWSIAYPSVAAAEETGAKSGCCVLYPTDLLDQASIRACGLTPARDF